MRAYELGGGYPRSQPYRAAHLPSGARAVHPEQLRPSAEDAVGKAQGLLDQTVPVNGAGDLTQAHDLSEGKAAKEQPGDDGEWNIASVNELRVQLGVAQEASQEEGPGRVGKGGGGGVQVGVRQQHVSSGVERTPQVQDVGAATVGGDD